MATDSCYTQLKYVVIIGLLVGACPIKNAFTSVNAGSLVYKRCSFHYLLSWVQLFFKFIAIVQAAVMTTVIEKSVIYSSSITDTLAEAVGFGMAFALGTICQVILIHRSGKFISFLKAVDQYDDVYCATKAKILSKSLVTALTHSLIMVVAPNVILYRSVFAKYSHIHILVVVISSSSTFVVMSYFITTFFVVELPVSFLYVQIDYLSSVMIHRLENLIGIVEGKSISSSHSTKLLADRILPKESERKGIFGQGDNAYNSTKFAWNTNTSTFLRNPLQIQNTVPGFSSKSWQAISKQYMDFQDLFFRFQNYVGAYFIVLYSCHIVSSVCMIYFCTNWNHPLIRDTYMSYILNSVIIIGLFRIIRLANTGEAFEKKYNLLLRILMRINQEDNFFGDEKKQFKRFLTVASTVPFRLSAVGFFYVNRQNLTSIVSVIITYIIVLLQFRVSEKSQPEISTTTSPSRTN